MQKLLLDSLIDNMDKEPLVSIVINCYNSEKYLKETIDSVIAQTYDNYEVIFWDNCSDDNTSIIIKGYKNSRFHYYLADKHTDLGEARIMAMEKVHGDYLAFLDSDDIWLPHFLERCVNAMLSSQNKYGAVYTNYFDWNEKSQKTHCPETVSGEKTLIDILTHYYIGMSANIINMKIVKDNNISLDNYYKLMPDYDFFIQIAAIASLFYIPTALVKYRVHSSSLSNKIKDGWAGEYDYLYKKCKRRFVDAELIKVDDLKYIKRHYQYFQMENLMSADKRWSLLLFLLKDPFLSLKAWTRILYVFGGNKLYSFVKRISR